MHCCTVCKLTLWHGLLPAWAVVHMRRYILALHCTGGIRLLDQAFAVLNALPSCLPTDSCNVVSRLHECSESLAPEGFQLLEPASAVLSGLRAQQLSVALVVPSSSAQLVRSCLDQANMTAQFTAVVSRLADTVAARQCV